MKRLGSPRPIAAARHRLGTLNPLRVGRIPALPVAVVVGLVAGASVFLALPQKYTTVHESLPSDPSADSVLSAQESVSSAKFMFGIMASALTDATGSITTISASIDPIFDSIDTARTGADQLVSALAEAPNLSSTAGQVTPLTDSISQALDTLQGFTGSIKQIDSFIAPIVSFLKKNTIPGTADA